MHHHADIDKRCREQVGDRNGIESDGDTFGYAIGANHFVAKLTPRIEDALAYLIAQISCEQTRVQCGKCLSFRFEYVPEPEFELFDVDIARARSRFFVSLIIDLDHCLRFRLCGDGKNITRLNNAFCFFAHGLQ